MNTIKVKISAVFNIMLSITANLAGNTSAAMLRTLRPSGGQSQYIMWLVAVALCAGTLFYMAEPAEAVEGGSGVYALGLTGPQAGFMPDSGTYVGYNLYYYKGDTTATVSVSGRVPIPGTGFELPAQLNGSISAKVDSFAHIVTITHVFEEEFLGGQAGLSLWVPYADADLKLAGQGVLTLTGPAGGIYDIPVSGSTEPGNNGIGDTTLIGMMGWHSGFKHYMVMLNVYAPTGKYDRDEIVNMGRNHWAIDPMMGITYLNENIGLELSAAAGITFNFKNSDTDYESGNEFHLDFAVIQHFSEKFNLGIVGYAYKQLSGDSGSGAPGDYKGRVYSLGPTIGSTIRLADKYDLFLKGRYYKEFDAENRMEGEAFLFTATTGF